MTDPTFDVFDIAHAYLATEGMCDDTGGCEYTRVRLEWETYPHDQRPDLIPFIRDRSNCFYATNYTPGDVTDEALDARWEANYDSGRLEVLADLIDALRAVNECMTDAS